MNQVDVPTWERYTLTIEEAAKYFRIGENKLRRLAEENKKAGWLIMNGNRIQIKRKQFEKVIDTLDVIQCKGLEYVWYNSIKSYQGSFHTGKEQIACHKKGVTIKVGF